LPAEPGVQGKENVQARTRTIAAIAAAAAALAAPAAAGAVTLQGAGSSAEQPILNVLFRAYHQTHKNIRFAYNPNGGNAGVKLVQQHRAQFAINTRPPLPSDSGTTYIKLFLDGLCVAVNPSNTLTNLSLTSVKNIFLGLDTNWTQVGGSNLTTTIDPVGRNSTAGSYTFFQQAVLGGATQASNVNPVTSDGLVQTTVKNDANAIGYVGLAHSGPGSGIKRLSLNGVPCDTAHIKNNSYPLWRWIWAVVPTPSATVKPSAQVEKFINWVATSSAAGGVISRAGAVPAFNK
jgi:phosphate transport system substrate-binding protein